MAAADVWWDRHPRSLSALGANEHLGRSPVDVIQGERRDLVGSHAELGQLSSGWRNPDAPWRFVRSPPSARRHHHLVDAS